MMLTMILTLQMKSGFSTTELDRTIKSHLKPNRPTKQSPKAKSTNEQQPSFETTNKNSKMTTFVGCPNFFLYFTNRQV
jgi:hypothetical protein